MKPLELVPASSAKSSNLAFALFSLPRARRTDAMLFYRFCRTVDDIADQPGLAVGEKHKRLEAWLTAAENGLPSDLESLVVRHSIDRSLFAEIVKGCTSDIEPRRFPNLADLELYCWRVACAVGLVSIKIFGCQNPQSETYAVHLGHALQLTNILRDIGEDASRGRIYLPQDDLTRFGVSEEGILNLQDGAGFKALMRHEADQARARFAAAVPPRADFKSLLPARIMSAVYQKILDRIEREHFSVLRKRVSLSPREKLTSTLGVFFRGF
jgi:phytoene synthase